MLNSLKLHKSDDLMSSEKLNLWFARVNYARCWELHQHIQKKHNLQFDKFRKFVYH